MRRCALALVTMFVGSTALVAAVDERAEIALIMEMEDQRIQAGVRKDTDAIAAAMEGRHVPDDPYRGRPVTIAA